MNKQFVKNIIKAKKYEYEAIKDILPDNVKKRLEKLEKDAVDLLKDAAMEIMKENFKEEKEDSGKKSAKRIEVDFS